MNRVFSFPQGALFVLRMLSMQKYEAYIVGGALRDALLDMPVHDVDIATNARPSDIEEVFSSYRTLNVGRRFGTIRVLLSDGIYEVTTFRSDGTYSDGRRPDAVTFSDAIEEDLSRRDFTVNAMAWNPEKGLIDLYGGCEDLKRGIIRAVGVASKRIEEDALRMLRAVRFASTLDFMLDCALFQAIVENASRISSVSMERCLEELEKMWAKRPEKALRLLAKTGLLAILLPDVCVEAIDYMALSEVSTLSQRWAVILSAGGNTLLLKKLKASNVRIREVQAMLNFSEIPASLPETRRLYGKLGLLHDDVLDYVRAKKGNTKSWEKWRDQIRDKELATTLKDLAISGEDLIALGYIQGKTLGMALKKLLDDVIEERLDNERSALLEKAKQKLEDWNEA